MTAPIAQRASVRELHRQELAVAVAVVSRGMLDNPLHIQAFGADPSDRLKVLTGMFGVVIPLVYRNGILLGAFINDQVAGVAGMVRPHGCQPSTLDMAIVLPRMLFALGFNRFSRLGQWLDGWKKYDPAEPHWHLGPVAVDAHLQGHGIGSALMGEYCARLDGEQTGGYLETDKPANVAFYKKFGFQTVSEATILNVPNWFMWRPAGALQQGTAGSGAPGQGSV
jgi:ribosomal protein S18 acetylase RimI-like enzyme